MFFKGHNDIPILRDLDTTASFLTSPPQPGEKFLANKTFLFDKID